MRFANLQDGWAFRPELYSTHDGGKTWSKETVSGMVWALEVADGKVWMLQGTCTTDFPSWCNLSVVTSVDNGETWRLSRSLPEMVPEKLVVVDSESALMLYYPKMENIIGELSERTPPQIIATSDGGSTWQPVNFPAACDGDWPIFDLAAADSQNLWFACGEIGAGPWGIKRVLTSLDGGQSWQLKAQVHEPIEPDDNITSHGAMINLYAFSAESALMILYRADPIVTNDGGQSWQISTIAEGTTAEDLDKRLIWVDPDHIWYYSAWHLFSTHDGGLTWDCQRAILNFTVAGCPQG